MKPFPERKRSGPNLHAGRFMPNRYSTFMNRIGADARRAAGEDPGANDAPASSDDPGPDRAPGLMRQLIDQYDADVTPPDWDRKTSESPTSGTDSRLH